MNICHVTKNNEVDVAISCKFSQKSCVYLFFFVFFFVLLSTKTSFLGNLSLYNSNLNRTAMKNKIFFLCLIVMGLTYQFNYISQIFYYLQLRNSSKKKQAKVNSLKILKCPYRQIFLLAILNLGTISILHAQKFFDLDKSFVLYGRLKLALGWTLSVIFRAWNEHIL